MRKTYVLVDGELVLKSEVRRQSHYVIGDLPDYESPIDGHIVHGRKGRREDFKRTQSRPYEGREQEAKEASRQQQYFEQTQERRLDESVGRAYAELHPDKRKLLRG